MALRFVLWTVRFHVERKEFSYLFDFVRRYIIFLTDADPNAIYNYTRSFGPFVARCVKEGACAKLKFLFTLDLCSCQLSLTALVSG